MATLGLPFLLEVPSFELVPQYFTTPCKIAET